MDDSTGDEVERLLVALSAYSVPPDKLEEGFPEFSAESKNTLVARIAGTFGPAPLGRLLARLPFILTEENKPDMVTAFISNLRAPDPEARRASLYGLEKLKHPAIADFALAALRDENDQVVTAASSILLPLAKEDARLTQIMQGVHAANKDNPEFHASTSLLETHVKTDEGAVE